MDALTWFKGVKKTRVHRDLGAHTQQTDPPQTVVVVFFAQGSQGPRGITGVPGPKGEAVSDHWLLIKAEVHPEAPE